MADLKISQLTSNPGIDGTEEMPTARSGSNFKNTFTALKTWILSAFDLQAVTDNGATTDKTILGDAGGATNYSLSPSGLAINIVAGGSTQYFSNQALLGNAAGASSSILNDGTAAFSDGGGNTVSIDPAVGVTIIGAGKGLFCDKITESAAGNGIALALTDSNNGAVFVQNVSGVKQVAEFIPESLHVHMGDILYAGNGTILEIDDSAGLMGHEAVHHRFNLTGYANDAAAVAGGLVTGDLYQITGTGVVMIVQ